MRLQTQARCLRKGCDWPGATGRDADLEARRHGAERGLANPGPGHSTECASWPEGDPPPWQD